MRGLIVGAAFLWLASTLYFLISWDWSPDSFLDWATAVICIVGLVLGVLGTIIVVVTGLWTEHQENKQWE